MIAATSEMEQLLLLYLLYLLYLRHLMRRTVVDDQFGNVGRFLKNNNTVDSSTIIIFQMIGSHPPELSTASLFDRFPDRLTTSQFETSNR